MKKYHYKLKVDNIYCKSCVSKINLACRNLNVKNIKVLINEKIVFIDIDASDLEIFIKRLKTYDIEVLNVEKNKTNYSLLIMLGYTVITILFVLVYFTFVGSISISSESSLLFVFIFGIINALHCISMCGPLFMVATKSKPLSATFKFLGGKIVSYTLMGLFLGITGSMFSLNTKLLGLFMLVVSFLMLGFALEQFGILKLPKLKRIKFTKSNSAFKLGLTNVFVPCGLLSMIFLVALSQTSILASMSVMFVFSIATSIVFVIVGITKQKVSPVISKYLSKLALLLIIFFAFQTFMTATSFLMIDHSNKAPVIDPSLYENTITFNIDSTYSFGELQLADEDVIGEQLFIKFDIKNLNSCIDNAFLRLPSGDTIEIDFTENQDGIVVDIDDLGYYMISCDMRMVWDSFELK